MTVNDLRRIWGNLTRRDPNPRFTRDALKAWLVQQSEGGTGYAWQCAYKAACSKFALTVTEISLDHRTPYSLVRETTLENLAVCCKRCNTVKGQIGADEFLALREFLATWPQPYRASVYNRLAQPPGFARRARSKGRG